MNERHSVQAVKPSFFIPHHLWLKMLAYARVCVDTEINGFGLVNFDNPSALYLQDIVVLEQEVTGGHAETSALHVARYLDELHEAGGKTGQLVFQWHSHVNMEVFFSPEDMGTINSWPGNWLISLVLNRSGQFLCRLDQLKPYRCGFEIEPQFVLDLPLELTAEAYADAARKLKRPGFFRRSKSVTLDGQGVQQVEQASPGQMAYGDVHVQG